jgi:type II secretory ATPase GspE/PulE/Tfp pilus assembly ATPase PilB-like protein
MSCCCRRGAARGDARRDLGAGRHGPRATEGLVSEEEIAGDYDAALTKLGEGMTSLEEVMRVTASD